VSCSAVDGGGRKYEFQFESDGPPIQQVWTNSESTKEEAQNSSCAALKNEPVVRRRRKPSDS